MWKMEISAMNGGKLLLATVKNGEWSSLQHKQRKQMKKIFNEASTFRLVLKNIFSPLLTFIIHQGSQPLLPSH